jgi:hypothetical protein
MNYWCLMLNSCVESGSSENLMMHRLTEERRWQRRWMMEDELKEKKWGQKKMRLIPRDWR